MNDRVCRPGAQMVAVSRAMCQSLLTPGHKPKSVFFHSDSGLGGLREGGQLIADFLWGSLQRMFVLQSRTTLTDSEQKPFKILSRILSGF